MFGGIVERYDLLNRLLSLGRDSYWRRELTRALQVDEPRQALDLCCGTGDVALSLLKSLPGLERLVAADFVLPMCAAAAGKLRARYPEPGVSSLACADALRLPFGTETFDIVSVAFGVRNFENLERGLAEIARVLKADGRVGILEFAPPEGRLLRLVYRPYLRLFPPLLGKLLAGAEGAYGYLSASIQSFLRPSSMLAALEKAGFHDPHARKLTLGVTYLYTASR
ncbi:MAG: hypothetical protein A3F83_15245 [Candidatus Glassbacteria bacterium RIFCSPLOWO2_12_FULL_58_11]|uniref:Demethylmenaquinone methyltransferase n=1 Tax=Candidatus Glassbacteria bacterium RIFCSPLOWO2_12_FULL_58_11 TaxID=1817867 RepID=A0A1F5YQH9_9BACT|nr:MAG: hypothetical protein A3F83_15245 [Candidatus Glassbacteria bacterium RIFCSPLOWO2_12_FULL_58_11]